jgi:hypothetical protein
MSSAQQVSDAIDKLSVTALRVKGERDELLAALKTLFGYIEDGTLVRNINQDNLADWQLRMMKFVNALSKAKVAIDKAEAA